MTSNADGPRAGVESSARAAGELETVVRTVLGESVRLDVRAYSSGTVLADLHDGGRSAAVDRISGIWSVAALTGPDRYGFSRFHRRFGSVTEAVTAAGRLFGTSPGSALAVDVTESGRGARQ